MAFSFASNLAARGAALSADKLQKRTVASVARRTVVSTRCSSSSDDERSAFVTRRNALLAGGLIAGVGLAAPSPANAEMVKLTLTKDKLGAPQIREQRDAVTRIAFSELSKGLTFEDAPSSLRLLLNDAATYDVATKTGGVDGSIVLDEELNRPENAMVKPFVAKLKPIKAAIDERTIAAGQGPISWADLIVIAAKVTAQLEWFEDKKKKTGDIDSARTLLASFGTAFPVTIGRKDATEPAPAGRVPAADASVAEIKEFLAGLGAKNTGGGFAAPKPPFWTRPAFVLYTASEPNPAEAEDRFVAADPEFAEWKKKYDKSRRTVTRTDYEVDFVDFFTKLTNLGAVYDKSMYLKDVVLEVKRF